MVFVTNAAEYNGVWYCIILTNICVESMQIHSLQLHAIYGEIKIKYVYNYVHTCIYFPNMWVFIDNSAVINIMTTILDDLQIKIFLVQNPYSWRKMDKNHNYIKTCSMVQIVAISSLRCEPLNAF